MLRKVIQSIVKVWFVAFIAALTFFAAQHAKAGVVIIDGRVASALTTTTPERPPGNETQGLTPDEQQVYLWASLLFFGHDAVIEEAAAHADETNGAPEQANHLEYLEFEPREEGCSAVTPSSWAMVLLALALMWRRRLRLTAELVGSGE